MKRELLELRFPAEPKELARVRKAVAEVTEDGGCSEDICRDVVMAVDEACQNVIRHAYGEDHSGDIVLRIEQEDERLVFWLTDFAPRVDPSKVRPRDLDDVRPGGLGTHLIREVMDEADFVEPPPGCGNLLRMVRRVE